MEQPPINIDPALSEYLSRVLTNLENTQVSLDKIQPITIVPTRPVIGKIYYFSTAILPSITAEGYWGYKSTGWIQIA